MIEAQQSKTRAKIAITKRIEKERAAKQEDIMRHYGTTIHTPKWYKQGRAECGKCGGEVVPVAGSARALGAC